MLHAKCIAVFIILLISNVTNASEATLRDKIGQMLIIGFNGKFFNGLSPVAQAIAQDNIGGVILFDYNSETQAYDKNIESPAQVKKLNKNLQQFALNMNKVRHRALLPLLISVDYEGGHVNRLHPRYGFPEIPSPQLVGQNSLDLAYETAELMAETMLYSGFNLNFAPGLDVNVNPDNPIIGKKERSFSADPNLVADYGQVYSNEFMSNKIHCAYKHFPGHGSSTTDSHLGFVDITDTWTYQELIPFSQLIAQPNHCDMVMVAHVVNRKLDDSGLPATLSKNMITGLLRDNLNFDGVVITDDMQMKAITDYYGLATALTLTINAGSDMVIFGNQLEQYQNPKELINLIESKVHTGEISEARINEAYNRIVKMKRFGKVGS